MADKELRCWKKVYEVDIPYVVSELKESVGRPALILLSGDMGVGKTTFVKTFVSDGSVQSPSYSLVTEMNNIAHADFYRIKDESEIAHLELGLYLEGKEYFFVEWGKKYVRLLERELDEGHSIYELKISFNENSPKDKPSRDYHLTKIDRNEV